MRSRDKVLNEKYRALQYKQEEQDVRTGAGNAKENEKQGDGAVASV